MQFITSLSALLLAATTAIALPNDLAARAGGPASKPIPDNCAKNNVIPAGSIGQPTLALNETAHVYSFFGNGAPYGNLTTCLEQCYGYGNPGSCVSAVLAYDALVPVGYYGSPGGEHAIGCIMYNRKLTAEDFQQPEYEGTYHDVQAINIDCP